MPPDLPPENIHRQICYHNSRGNRNRYHTIAGTTGPAAQGVTAIASTPAQRRHCFPLQTRRALFLPKAMIKHGRGTSHIENTSWEWLGGQLTLKSTMYSSARSPKTKTITTKRKPKNAFDCMGVAVGHGDRTSKITGLIFDTPPLSGAGPQSRTIRLELRYAPLSGAGTQSINTAPH